ncbi:MAG: sensor histidine kinase [Lachnospiraceae bacterium]|nr:sensor histidine kinase [Lachnospiraceae bacterium]
MKLRSKLIWSYCLISIIPLLFLSIFATNRMAKDIRKDMAEFAARSASQAGEAMDVYIDVYHELMMYLIEAMEREASLANAEALMIRRHEEVMSGYPEIVGIALADESDRFIGTGMERISRDPVSEEKWFQEAIGNPDGLTVLNASENKVIITNKAYSADKIFSILGTGRVNGINAVILMDIKKDVFQTLIESVAVSSDSFVFVTDEKGAIVYTPVNPVVYRLDGRCLFLESGKQEKVLIQGDEYLVSAYKSKSTDWNFISVTSLYEQKQNMIRMYLILALITVVVLAAAIMISIKLADSFDDPIQKLITKMRLVEKGDLSVRADLKYQDEIGMLGRTFDHMLERMNIMMEEIQTEKQRALTARLKSLQEQIKPHFLYNTLDTINWMAREHQADDVVKMVEALTNMFRLGLSQGKDFITVKEEIGHVTNYLYIQSVRYGDKLTYDINVSGDCLEMVIPKLILQPLVENSIYHGIKLKKGGGRISVNAKKQGEELILSVYDTGAGLSREKLSSLRESIVSIREGGTGSFGMTYIIERLRLYAGDEFDIEIESVKGAFTEVVIRLRERESTYV